LRASNLDAIEAPRVVLTRSQCDAPISGGHRMSSITASAPTELPADLTDESPRQATRLNSEPLAVIVEGLQSALEPALELGHP
jgi:hypothetical protein